MSFTLLFIIVHAQRFLTSNNAQDPDCEHEGDDGNITYFVKGYVQDESFDWSKTCCTYGYTSDYQAWRVYKKYCNNMSEAGQECIVRSMCKSGRCVIDSMWTICGCPEGQEYVYRGASSTKICCEKGDVNWHANVWSFYFVVDFGFSYCVKSGIPNEDTCESDDMCQSENCEEGKCL